MLLLMIRFLKTLIKLWDNNNITLYLYIYVKYTFFAQATLPDVIM